MIYILGTPQETAQALDDKSLDRMIKDIAQVLCNVHWLDHAIRYSPNLERFEKLENSVPLKEKSLNTCSWSQWAKDCEANYLYLVELGLELMVEHVYPRCLGPTNKYMEAILWAKGNVPVLTGDEYMTCPLYFPLVMPKKYYRCNCDEKGYFRCDWGSEQINTIESYRNYYRSKLKGSEVWTRREKPDWLNL